MLKRSFLFRWLEKHSCCVLLKKSAKVQPLSQKEEWNVQSSFLVYGDIFIQLCIYMTILACFNFQTFCVNYEEYNYLTVNVISSHYEKWTILGKKQTEAASESCHNMLIKWVSHWLFIHSYLMHSFSCFFLHLDMKRMFLNWYIWTGTWYKVR